MTTTEPTVVKDPAWIDIDALVPTEIQSALDEAVTEGQRWVAPDSEFMRWLARAFEAYCSAMDCFEKHDLFELGKIGDRLRSALQIDALEAVLATILPLADLERSDRLDDLATHRELAAGFLDGERPID